jgi:hypothetical protein
VQLTTVPMHSLTCLLFASFPCCCRMAALQAELQLVREQQGAANNKVEEVRAEVRHHPMLFLWVLMSVKSDLRRSGLSLNQYGQRHVMLVGFLYRLLVLMPRGPFWLPPLSPWSRSCPNWSC